MSTANLKKRAFNIYGNNIVFYDLMLDTAHIISKLERLKKYYIDIIHKNYISTNNLDVFMQKNNDILFEAQSVFYRTTVSGLKEQNCAAGDEIRNIFSYTEELSTIYDYWEQLNSYYVEKTEYIPQKKWIGGGLGVKGAIKGAITAGAFNAVGNFISSIKHSSEISHHNSNIDDYKRKLYKDEGFEKTFIYAIACMKENSVTTFKNSLSQKYEYDVYENIDYQKANMLYSDMLDNSDMITGKNVSKVLQMCPYFSEIYIFALNNLEGDTTELGALYKLCLKNDSFDNARKRKAEILLCINSGRFSELLELCKKDRSIIMQIKNTVIEEYEAKAINIFLIALNGGDTSKVADMIAFVEIMKEYLQNWNIFYLAGKIYEECQYGVRANLEKSIVLYKIAAKSNSVEAISRLAEIYYVTGKVEEAETWAKKALKISPTLVSAKITLASAMNKRPKTVLECKEALNLYSELSSLPYSQFKDYHHRKPSYFCYCAYKIYSEKKELMDENKKAEWCVKGATIAANYPDDLYGVTCCAVAIPLLQKYHKFKKVIELCLMYKGRYIGADWQLGYAYCRGDQVTKDYNKGAECFLSVINNYNDLTSEPYQKKRNDAKTALSKMTCTNGVWKKKMFEHI